MNKVDKISRENMRTDIPDFSVGDTIRVQMSIVEGGKERLQPLHGTVIARRGEGSGQTAVLRRVSYGFGVEHIVPLHSPYLSSIEVLRKGKVKRSKLYYLRDRQGKAARVNEA